MMRNLDFSSWQSMITTLLSLVIITILMVGLRLLLMQTVQQRRERENRQINERLRTLIAAYKTLGGSFTGILAVDPTHLRDLLRRQAAGQSADGSELDLGIDVSTSSDRSRRIRDAVEAALSDVILLGTEDQVRLAAKAASELVAGRIIHTHELVVSLRDFIRDVLDLDKLPGDIAIPNQGPARPATGSGSGGKNKATEADREGKQGKGDMQGMQDMGIGFGGGLALDHDHDEHH